ncbi:maltokinase N-terminal cap-like domain-containing protein [Gordonia humi]|uniref:Maltokinase N-terminal cap domain-containing protein n=1 Tax=Gordonia humi TaxID=686429 RepID=A0A840F3M1_9ACTN|nr:hypothetical protein [Gordonia humi]MBB4137058.1 hypothetical protein [Gordonia humi]
MAIIYEATLSPGKDDMIRRRLDEVPWGPTGDVERLAAFRFDDPAGAVGIEAHIVACGGRTLHVPLTYRGAPLDGVTAVGTMEHSVLGRRWVYAAGDDPVAVAAYLRALRGEHGPADLELHRGDGGVEALPTSVTLSVRGTAPTDGALRLTGDLADPVTGDAELVAEWSAGSAVVAAIDATTP